MFGNEQGFEDFHFHGSSGVLAIRVCYNSGKLELGVQPKNGSKKLPEVMMELTPWLQQRLVKAIGPDYDVHTEQYRTAIDALQNVVVSETHEAARTLAKEALGEISALDE